MVVAGNLGLRTLSNHPFQSNIGRGPPMRVPPLPEEQWR